MLCGYSALAYALTVDKQKNIDFVWLPRHIGIEGNELADKLANAATAEPSIDINIGLELSEAYTLIDRYILGKWQIEKRQDGLCNHCNKSETVSHFLTECSHSPTCLAVQPTPAERDAALPPLRLQQIPQRFDIPVWNVHQATIDRRDRTNNSCEGWNTSFASLVGHHRPSFWTAVEALRLFHLSVAILWLEGKHR